MVQKGVTLLCALSLLIGLSGVLPCRAEVMKEYYLIVDDTYTFSLSEQLYEQIRGMWDGANGEQILELLRQVFGRDQVPAQAQTMTMRVYTYNRTGGDSSGTLEGADGGAGGQSGETEADDPDFDILSGRLMRYRGREKVVIVPDTVTSIAQGAFYENDKVQKIIVPASVKKIEKFAFYDCGRLKYVVFAGKSKTVGSNMIYRCDQLESIVAPRRSKEWQYAEKNGIRVFERDRATLGQGTLRILVGDREKLVLYNTLEKVRWQSSNRSVAKVSGSGSLRGCKKGTAKITASVGKKRYPLTVRVAEKSEDKRIEQIIRTVIKKGMSDRERVKAVHDWLIRNVKYDYYHYLRGAVPRVSHTSEGALLRGMAVCDGYSRAMNKVLSRIGIPCRMVTGTSKGGGHAWNQVKVGGKWLYVDVTFDDPIVNGKNTNTKPYYTYFLKTAKQMRRDHSW